MKLIKNTIHYSTCLIFLLLGEFSRGSIPFNKNISGFKSLDSLILSQSVYDTCHSINELTKKIEQTLSESSCPTDSQSEFNSCVQISNSLKPNEGKTLQLALNDLNKINEANCNALPKDQLVARFRIISNFILSH